MGYIICDEDSNVVGKLFFDTNKNYRECVFREDGFSGIKDEFILKLQLEGISKYENLEKDRVLCLVGSYRILVDFFTLKLIVKNQLDKELRSYSIQKGYPKNNN